MTAGVGAEVELELGNYALDHTPGRLAGVGHDPHQGQRRPASWARRLAVVGPEQAVLGGGIEVVVDGQVAEVEHPVPGAGVFPVDEDGGGRIGAAGQDVGAEEIVVARDGIGEREHGGDPVGERAGGRVAVGHRAASLADDALVIGQQVGHPEARRQRQARVVKGPQGARRGGWIGPQPVGVDRLAVDELGHQVAVAGGHERGSNLQPGRLRGGQALGLAIDPEQTGAGPGQAQDAIPVAKAHAKVAIGDAAVQRLRRGCGGSELGLELGHDVPRFGHRRET